MAVSFGIIIGAVTALLPAVLLALLLSVLLTFSDSTHQNLLLLASREVALTTSQTVAAKLDAGYRETQSGMRISKRIGVTPYDASSPPAINSQSYTPAQITALGLDALPFVKNLWLPAETRVMQQYNSGFTYLGMFTMPFPHQLSPAAFDAQFTSCRYGNGETAIMRWLSQRGSLEANIQLHDTHPLLAGVSETPVNITGSGLWNEQLKLPKSRDRIFAYLAARPVRSRMSTLPPNGTTWLAQKRLGASLAAAAIADTASADFRIPFINEQQLRVIEQQYFVGSLLSTLNRTVIATLVPMDFRVAQPLKDRLGDTRCLARLNVAALLDAAIKTFFQIAGYPADHYTPFDLLANEAKPAASFEEAVARDVQARKNSKSRESEPVFYFIDGRGNPIHSSEGVLYADFRSNLSSPTQPHPMESLPGCIGIAWPKFDGSSGFERIVSCPRNVTDDSDSEFVLLSQLRKNTAVNVTDFRAAMLAANRSSAMLRIGAKSNKAADLSAQFRHTWVTDPRDGTRYEVTIAPLVTEDPSLWHYSIVVFTPENFRRGDVDTRRNVSIGIAVAICIVAVVATFLATLVISRYVARITLQMADPIGLDKLRAARQLRDKNIALSRPAIGGSSGSSAPGLSAATATATTLEQDAAAATSGSPCGFFSLLENCLEKLEELDEVEAAFVHCRSMVEELRAFVNQDALLLLQRRSKRKNPQQSQGVAALNSTASMDSFVSRSSDELSRAASGGAPAGDWQSNSAACSLQSVVDTFPLRKKKSVRFAAAAPEESEPSAGPTAATAAASAEATTTAAAAVAVADTAQAPTDSSCSSASDNDDGRAEDEDASVEAATKPRRSVPVPRRIDPTALRLFSCVVVNFPIVQRVAASTSLLREVTAAAADMCHSLLSRLPVMAIEQFLGDGLVCVVHIRSLERRSRTLSTVVEQLIRNCVSFEQKIDEIMVSRAPENANAAVCEDAILMNGGVLKNAAEQRFEDDENLPLVAVGIFCGPLRISHQRIAPAYDISTHSSGSDSTSDKNNQNRNDDEITENNNALNDSAASSSLSMRATTFIGPLVAHADKLCRERSVTASTSVSMYERDEEAETIFMSMKRAELELLSGRFNPINSRSKNPNITIVRWRGTVYFAVAFRGEADGDSRYRGGAVLSETGVTKHVRYVIHMPRCFLGLAIRVRSRVLQSSADEPASSNSNAHMQIIALQATTPYIFLSAKAKGGRKAELVYGISRIAGWVEAL